MTYQLTESQRIRAEELYRQWEAEPLVRRVGGLDRAAFMMGYELAAQELVPKIRNQALEEAAKLGEHDGDSYMVSF